MTTALDFCMSPCPNDTFAFWAALHGQVRHPDFELRLSALADIEALNAAATGERTAAPMVTKLSVPALAAVTDRYAVLPAGAALGFGCGPLALRRQGDGSLRSLADLAGRRVAIPGLRTTAYLLLRMFGPADCEFVPMRFEQVMPAVARGDCDAGLVIHESRFTYPDHGLALLADLGELWEQEAQAPLPLGLIAIRRDLGPAAFAAAAALLRASVEAAQRRPDAPWAFVREHAAEMDEAVCRRHIALYVNERTVDLGAPGRAAVDAMLQHGRELGLLPQGSSPWLEGL